MPFSASNFSSPTWIFMFVSFLFVLDMLGVRGEKWLSKGKCCREWHVRICDSSVYALLFYMQWSLITSERSTKTNVEWFHRRYRLIFLIMTVSWWRIMEWSLFVVLISLFLSSSVIIWRKFILIILIRFIVCMLPSVFRIWVWFWLCVHALSMMSLYQHRPLMFTPSLLLYFCTAPRWDTLLAFWFCPQPQHCRELATTA